jgi:hypothetical protein
MGDAAQGGIVFWDARVHAGPPFIVEADGDLSGGRLPS